MIDLDRIKRLLAAATPGEWRLEEDWTYEVTAPDGSIVAKVPYPRDGANAALIAAAPGAIRELVGEVERLREALREIRDTRSQPEADLGHPSPYQLARRAAERMGSDLEAARSIAHHTLGEEPR